MTTITREEFNEWKGNNVTQAFFTQIYKDREEMKEGLANAAYLNDDEVRGRCKVIALFLDLTYEDLVPRVWNPNQVEQDNE